MYAVLSFNFELVIIDKQKERLKSLPASALFSHQEIILYKKKKKSEHIITSFWKK